MTPKNTLNFTMKALEAIKPNPERRMDYFDPRTKCLCFAVYTSGTKTWFFYGSIKNRPERIKIGRFPQIDLPTAKKRLKKIQGQIAMGANPNQAKRDLRAEPTLRQFFEESFMIRYARVQKKSWRQDEKLFKNYLSPLSSRKLSSITDAQVSRLHRKIGTDNGQVVANRAVMLLSAIFNKAKKWKAFAGDNPASAVDLFPEVPKETYLTKDEIRLLMASVMEENDAGFHVFVHLCLMTGLRSGNLFSLKWSQISDGFERLELPRANMKNKKNHVVPLTSQAAAILRTWKSQCDCNSEFVFHEGDTSKCGRRYRYLFSKASKNSGIECTLHILRHSVASQMVSSGVSLAIVQQVLGHLNYRSTLRYAHVAPSSVRESLRLVTDNFFADSEETDTARQAV